MLGNDTDPDGDAMTAVLVSGPANARVFHLDPDGSFEYASNPDYNGTDSFTYVTKDASGLPSDPYTVTDGTTPEVTGNAEFFRQF